MVPDYYAMLGVDPGADRAALEAALARCQPVWSSGTRNPKTKHTYQSYLDQIPALRQALLGDPSARAAYDAELAAARRAERDARLDSLQKRIRLRAAKGGLTVSDRTLLRDEAVRLGLTADDLDRLVEPIPPRPEVARRGRARRPAPPTCSTRSCAGRSAWRSSTSGSATSTTPSAWPATPRAGDRRPGRRRAPALDEEDPGHRREDRLARSRLARAVAPDRRPPPAPATTGRSPSRPRNARRVDRVRPQGPARLDPGTRAAAARRGGRARGRARPRRAADRPGLPDPGRRARPARPLPLVSHAASTGRPGSSDAGRARA